MFVFSVGALAQILLSAEIILKWNPVFKVHAWRPVFLGGNNKFKWFLRKPFFNSYF